MLATTGLRMPHRKTSRTGNLSASADAATEALSAAGALFSDAVGLQGGSPAAQAAAAAAESTSVTAVSAALTAGAAAGVKSLHLLPDDASWKVSSSGLRALSKIACRSTGADERANKDVVLLALQRPGTWQKLCRQPPLSLLPCPTSPLLPPPSCLLSADPPLHQMPPPPPLLQTMPQPPPRQATPLKDPMQLLSACQR